MYRSIEQVEKRILDTNKIFHVKNFSKVFYSLEKTFNT